MSAIASPAIDPTPIEGYQLTLKDLYETLDWSGVEETEERWIGEQEHLDDQSERLTGEPDFKAKFRMVLIDEALHGKYDKRKWEARSWLRRAGIWHQVVHYYEEHGLIAKELTAAI